MEVWWTWGQPSCMGYQAPLYNIQVWAEGSPVGLPVHVEPSWILAQETVHTSTVGSWSWGNWDEVELTLPYKTQVRTVSTLSGARSSPALPPLCPLALIPPHALQRSTEPSKPHTFHTQRRLKSSRQQRHTRARKRNGWPGRAP